MAILPVCADLDPFHKNITALLNTSAAAPTPPPGQAVNVSRVIITAVLTKYNLTAFNQDLQTLYTQTIANLTGVREVSWLILLPCPYSAQWDVQCLTLLPALQVKVLSLRSGSVLIDTEVYIDSTALPGFAADLTSGSSATFPPDGPLGPVSVLDPSGRHDTPACTCIRVSQVSMF